VELPMLEIKFAELGSTGWLAMLVFHALSAGNGSEPFNGATIPNDALAIDP
jgi:hypothetical protein